MNVLNLEPFMSISDCTWDEETRVLESNIPILYHTSPPQDILVHGQTKTVTFYIDRSSSRLNRTIYKNDELSIELRVPWWDDQKKCIVT